MKLIKAIRDTDFMISLPNPVIRKERRASRAVVFDKDKNVALLNVTKNNYHKLPGGGIEEGESIDAALRRELLEEIGCAVENVRELGIIEEYRGKFELHQISYCFIADLSGEKGEPNFDEGEIEDGFKPEWLSLEDAIRTLEGETGVEDYEGKFIRVRDLALLEEARDLLAGIN